MPMAVARGPGIGCGVRFMCRMASTNLLDLCGGGVAVHDDEHGSSLRATGGLALPKGDGNGDCTAPTPFWKPRLDDSGTPLPGPH